MMKAPRATVLLLLFVALAPEALARDPETRLYRSAAFLGRGDTGIAIAEDEDAIFYNPANLAAGKGIYRKTVLLSPQVEVSQATKDLAKQVMSKNPDAIDTVRNNIGKPNHVGASDFFGIVLRRAAFGVIASSSVDLLAYKSPEPVNGGLEVVTVDAEANAGFTFSLAESFFKDQLLVGFTAKYLQRGRGEIAVSAAEADKAAELFADTANFVGMGQGGGADVGATWKLGGRAAPTVSIVVADVGDTKITPDLETDLDLDLKQRVNVGFAIEPGTKFSKLKLLADYHDALGRTQPNVLKRTHLGAEISVLALAGVSAGLNQGYPTAGVYVDVHFLRLDFAAYTEEVGTRVGTRPDPRYVMRIEIGF